MRLLDEKNKTMIRNKILERFLRYVAIDTQSDESSTTYPSTEKQKNLLNLLLEELLAMGVKDASIDKYGYLTATIESNVDNKNLKTIAFLAHVDTSPDMSGKDVRPQIIENYDGKDIPLGEKEIMKVSDFPELEKFIGHTLITTDGSTLLGADDKAGVAEIMTAVEILITNPNIKHGTIKIAFTPDEEIGKGVDFFDVESFGADYAYTMDGGIEGELEYENFNAASAKIIVSGRNIHPGYAKDKMINAIDIFTEFHQSLPFAKPQNTEGYEGFVHLNSLNAIVERAEASYIIRDHSKRLFDSKKATMQNKVKEINEKYNAELVKLELKDQYYNMGDIVNQYPELIDKAIKAMEKAEVLPIIKPIRGGTDGARLSFMGLPCPNIFAGGMNFHGKYEYVSLDSMLKATNTIVHLAEIWAE